MKEDPVPVVVEDVPAATVVPAVVVRTVEAWAAMKQPAAWLLAAARMLRAWPIGREVNEDDFDRALSDAGSVALR